ncbi:hypothetical protein HBI82_069420 [Parastagonospora nodorum]|nr:hypothetical protein HBH95_085370 [Parastagonospora nodorum]KAH5101556.1 hypothetical protein HBH72_093320 [Parastagonospora nodorum]KAH6023800.1 hypothetical protein HBI82_069420 [Parastagonospora nodorum]
MSSSINHSLAWQARERRQKCRNRHVRGEDLAANRNCPIVGIISCHPVSYERLCFPAPSSSAVSKVQMLSNVPDGHVVRWLRPLNSSMSVLCAAEVMPNRPNAYQIPMRTA